MKNKPVTLADLRKAAPKGSTVLEQGAWVMVYKCDKTVIVDLRHEDRQTARRMALAALQAMGRTP